MLEMETIQWKVLKLKKKKKTYFDTWQINYKNFLEESRLQQLLKIKFPRNKNMLE